MKLPIAGIIRAMVITINRISTAEFYNNTVGVQLQKDALTNFIVELRSNVGIEATSRTNLVPYLTSAVITPVFFTSSDVYQFEGTISSAWNAAQLAVFQSFDADDATIEQARKLLVVQDIYAVANITFPDGLASSSLLSSLTTLAALNTASPSYKPTTSPTAKPTTSPTAKPTTSPTAKPIKKPTTLPTKPTNAKFAPTKHPMPQQPTKPFKPALTKYPVKRLPTNSKPHRLPKHKDGSNCP